MVRVKYLAVFSFSVLLVVLVYVKRTKLISERFSKNVLRSLERESNYSEWIHTSTDKRKDLYGDSTCGDNPHRQNLEAIFKRWTEIAAKLDIKYFLTAGTLLATWRNGQLIPYDTDLDVLIDSRDNEKLEAIKEKRNFQESDNKFHLVLQEDWRLPYSERRRFKCNGVRVKVYSDHCSYQEPLGRIIRGDFHLDIYDYKMRNNTLYDPSEWEKEFSISDVFPLKKCTLIDIATHCPNNPTAILKEFYGNDLSPSKICSNGVWKNKE